MERGDPARLSSASQCGSAADDTAVSPHERPTQTLPTHAIGAFALPSVSQLAGTAVNHASAPELESPVGSVCLSHHLAFWHQCLKAGQAAETVAEVFEVYLIITIKKKRPKEYIHVLTQIYLLFFFAFCWRSWEIYWGTKLQIKAHSKNVVQEAQKYVFYALSNINQTSKTTIWDNGRSDGETLLVAKLGALLNISVPKL